MCPRVPFEWRSAGTKMHQVAVLKTASRMKGFGQAQSRSHIETCLTEHTPEFPVRLRENSTPRGHSESEPHVARCSCSAKPLTKNQCLNCPHSGMRLRCAPNRRGRHSTGSATETQGTQGLWVARLTTATTHIAGPRILCYVT